MERTYFFDWISHSHLFNKLQIQPTHMNKYSSSLSLVFHSLIHTLIQVISHTYVTLEPQVLPFRVRLANPRILVRSRRTDANVEEMDCVTTVNVTVRRDGTSFLSL